MTALDQLKGPADPDHFRVQVGRNHDRWYVDPLDADAMFTTTTRQFPSVSGVLKASGEDWSFASIKRIAAAAQAMPHMLDGLDAESMMSTMQMWNKDGLRRAQNRGTDVHAYIDQRLNGFTAKQIRDAGLIWENSEANAFLPAVESFLDYYTPKVIARRSEVVVIHRDLHGWGYGGTLDAIIDIGGKTYLVDWKTRTGKFNVIYAKEPMQGGAYGGAQYVIVERDGRAVREEMPHIDGGLIVSIGTTGVQVYPFDLGMAFETFCEAHAWWTARREETKCQLQPWAPVASSSASPPPTLQLVTSWPKGRLDRLRERIMQLVERGYGPILVDALNAAQLPGLAKGGHSDEQLDAMQSLVERIESESDKTFDAHDTIEGANVSGEELHELTMGMRLLTAQQRDWIINVVDACAAVRKSISVREQPSQRRCAIAEALVYLTANTWDKDGPNLDIVAAAFRAADVRWTGSHEQYGSLTIDEALRLSKIAQGIGSTLRVVTQEDDSFMIEPNT